MMASVKAGEFPCECLQGKRAGWWDVAFSCVTMLCYFHLSQKDGVSKLKSNTLKHNVMSFHICQSRAVCPQLYLPHVAPHSAHSVQLNVQTIERNLG